MGIGRGRVGIGGVWTGAFGKGRGCGWEIDSESVDRDGDIRLCGQGRGVEGVYTPRHTPPKRPLKRVVCIILECILVLTLC